MPLFEVIQESHVTLSYIVEADSIEDAVDHVTEGGGVVVSRGEYRTDVYGANSGEPVDDYPYPKPRRIEKLLADVFNFVVLELEMTPNEQAIVDYLANADMLRDIADALREDPLVAAKLNIGEFHAVV